MSFFPLAGTLGLGTRKSSISSCLGSGDLAFVGVAGATCFPFPATFFGLGVRNLSMPCCLGSGGGVVTVFARLADLRGVEYDRRRLGDSAGLSTRDISSYDWIRSGKAMGRCKRRTIMPVTTAPCSIPKTGTSRYTARSTRVSMHSTVIQRKTLTVMPSAKRLSKQAIRLRSLARWSTPEIMKSAETTYLSPHLSSFVAISTLTSSGRTSRSRTVCTAYEDVHYCSL